MTETKTLSLTTTLTFGLILASTSMLACDSGTDEGPSGERGLGEAAVLIQDLAANASSTPASAGPEQIASAATSDPSPVNGAAIGLPSRDKDLIGWMRWSGALPYYAGPIFDESGEQCGEGQAGNIWYLPGTAGGPAVRSCTIPVGKQLVFPLLNYYAAVPDSYYNTPESLQTRLESFAANSAFFHELGCDLSATLDGVPLYGGELDPTWVDVLEPFDVTLPDDPDNFADWFGLVGGTTPAVGSGFYARTAPLTPGEHTLEFGGSLCFEGEIWFETHASYTITVE